MTRLAGKAVLIAGAAGDIGSAVARRFAEEGADLALFDIGPKVKQLSGLTDGDALIGEMDLTDEQSCNAAVATTVERYGRIDVVAIIAGVNQEATPIDELSSVEWDRVMNVNLKGPFLLSRAVIPHLSTGGSMVTIGSWWGHAGHAYFSAYCSAKAGLIVFTQCLADELAAKRSRANCICPGNVDTSMHTGALHAEAEERGITFEEMKAIEWAKIPLGKAGDPVDVANAALFLSSDDAKYITGASIDVNGGVLFR